MRALLLFAVAAASLSAAFGAHSDSDVSYTVPAATRTPKADGVIVSYEYQGTMTFAGVGRPKAVDERLAECAFTWDATNFYIAVRSATGPDGALVAKEGPHNLCYDDSVEFWFNPPEVMRQMEFARFGVFQIIANSKGALEGHHYNPGYGLAARQLKLKGVEVGNSVHGDVWDFEIKIPAAVFGCNRLDESDWGMVFARTFRSGRNAQGSFQPYLGMGYADVKSQTCHRLRRKASPTPSGKAVTLSQGVRLPVPGNITVKVETHGPVTNAYRRFFTTTPLGRSGTLGLQEQRDYLQLFFHGRGNHKATNLLLRQLPSRDAETVYSVNVTPKQADLYIDGAWKGKLEFPEPIAAEEIGEITLSRTDFDLTAFRVRAGVAEAAEIAADAQGSAGVSGAIKWYPSINAVALDLRVAETEFAKGLSLSVGGKSYPVTGKGAVKVGRKRPVLAIHEVVKLGGRLADGEYVAELKVGGETALKHPFKAANREWFGSKEGRSDILLPGFTPVKAEGRAVEVVGRKYVFGDDGLPQEVWAKGKQILARPVKLTSQTSQTSQTFQTSQTSATTVAFRGGLASGRVEQDGLIRFKLKLPETDRATLEIPLKKEFAILYHPVSECIRVNPAGFVPKGEGKVFGSRDIPQIHVSDFIPYCWVGTDDRGICFAADSEKGWAGCDERDMVEIHREADGTVVLKLNIVSRPTPAHEVELALMASPVKPQPEGWRGWADAYPYPCTRQMCCQMSGPCWGNYFSEMGRTPAFGDFGYVRKLTEAMETGKDDLSYRSNWIARVEKDLSCAPWLQMKDPSVRAKALRDHISGGFHVAKHLHGRPDPTPYFYVCDCSTTAGLPDMDLMKDEWGPSISMYGSFQDYSIYNLGKMVDAGMKGIYNDNSFFVANYDWVTGDAWIDEKGEVHPSFQLWANREYRRREAVVQVEHGVKRPWITIHHTNALILPTMSFGTNTMGMEWKYGATDFQERWTPDYVRAVCQGIQCGVYPTCLEGIFQWKTKEERIRLTRTMMAVLLPHEVQPVAWAANGQTVMDAYTRLWEFGYHQPDCVYTAYWDAANPLVQREDVLVSTYRRGDRVLAVVGSYAKEDVALELKPKAGAVISAKDVFDARPVEVRDGIARIALPRHDFALVELTLR